MLVCLQGNYVFGIIAKAQKVAVMFLQVYDETCWRLWFTMNTGIPVNMALSRFVFCHITSRPKDGTSEEILEELSGTWKY